LEQLGGRFGVTKERIRQLESRALEKLRKIAMDEKLDIPGI
jgi:DNA-directed RNA polymerase sigma subunit (sigma70/sigma32)